MWLVRKEYYGQQIDELQNQHGDYRTAYSRV